MRRVADVRARVVGAVVALALAAVAAGCAREEPRAPADAARPLRRGPDPVEGFGSATRGGAGGRVVTITEPSERAVRRAFKEAQRGATIVRFAVDQPIPITRMIPRLTHPHVTIEGAGATLDGSNLAIDVALIDVRTHDVIVRDLRVRNGYDNVRVQGPEAHDVVISHVSSTGARDDGIAISHGARDVTVQYVLLAGNTRSMFVKYGGTTNLSLHHSWILKGWTRNPLISGAALVDVRNVIVEDWTEWGVRFEDGAHGNVVGSLFALSPYAAGIGGKAHGALRLVDAGALHLAGNAFRGRALPGPRGTAAVPHTAPPVGTFALAVMEEHVRARAGCLPRDAVDRGYVTRGAGWRVTATEPLRPQPTPAD